MNCKKCDQPITNKDLACPICSIVNVEYQFENSAFQTAFNNNVKEVEAILQTYEPNSKYDWNESVAQMAGVVEQTKLILNSKEWKMNVPTRTVQNMNHFLQRCESAELHIALVGTIKAGKSTLINALLGYDLASTRVTPETASLTKFRTTSDQNYVKVSFYSQAEWEQLWRSAEQSNAKVFLEEYAALNADQIKEQWLNHAPQMTSCETIEELKEEIHKWSSSKTATHYFVKEVEVGLTNLNMPEGVVFVDTPGLDDVVAYRSNITRDYINRANAVLVCVKADSLTGPEMRTIYSVFANTRYNPEKVYIVATQLDTLNRPIEHWREQQVEWLKYIKDDGAYGNERLAIKNLIPVSGYLYSLLNSFDTIEADSDEYFELNSILSKFRVTFEQAPNKLQDLLDFTGIDSLKRQLEDEVVSKYHELLLRDIESSYGMYRDEMTQYLNEIKANQLEMIEYSEKDISEIQERKRKHEEQLVTLEKEQKELEGLVKMLKKTTTDRVHELTEILRKIEVN